MVSNRLSIFVATQEGDIQEYDVQTGDRLKTLQGHNNCVCALLLFDGNLFSAGRDMIINKWDILTGEIVQIFNGHLPQTVVTLCYGEFLFTSGCSGSIIQFRASDGVKMSIFEGHSGNIIEMKVFDNSLYSSSEDNTLIKWNMHGELVHIFRHRTPIHSFTVLKKALYTICDEELIYQWDILTGIQVRIIGKDGPLKLSLFGCGNKLFSTNTDSTISSYDLLSGNVNGSLYPEASTTIDRSAHILKTLTVQNSKSSFVDKQTDIDEVSIERYTFHLIHD